MDIRKIYSVICLKTSMSSSQIWPHCHLVFILQELHYAEYGRLKLQIRMVTKHEIICTRANMNFAPLNYQKTAATTTIHDLQHSEVSRQCLLAVPWSRLKTKGDCGSQVMEIASTGSKVCGLIDIFKNKLKTHICRIAFILFFNIPFYLHLIRCCKALCVFCS